MSHPSKPRVSPNSPAALALSHAGDEQQQAHTSTPNAAATNAPEAGASQSNSGSDNPGSLVTQAQNWLQDSGLTERLTQVQVPESLKRLGGQAAGGWNRLSTSQKVLGAAVLAAGGWYLLSRNGGSQARPASAKRQGSSAPALHELLLFVNDRVEGYRRAASESKEAEYQSYYQQLAAQSQQFASRLNTYLRDQDGSREDGTTLKGKLYRAWMDAKAAITGFDEKAILQSNVYGEEWALKAYEEALSDPTLKGALRQEVQRQFAQSKQTHQKLQRMYEQR